MLDRLPIMRPKLPAAESLRPYLARIDSARVYSNFGPLSTELESRLGAHFQATDLGVTLAANATLALTLALVAQGARRGTLCAMPAWSFVASAQAATLAGLTPYFVDVDRHTWALDPGPLSEIIATAPGEIGAVMPVAPFGLAIDIHAWDRFSAASGVPVVIDAAAAFDTVAASATPSVVSLHATKVFGIGEGGLVLCNNTDLIRDIRARMNFGFHGRREAVVEAFNAKLSEYHAAVGLAGMDAWSSDRAEWQAIAARYRERLRGSTVARLQDGFGDRWVSSVCVLDLGRADADRLAPRLAAAGIETRRWWGNGAHAHESTSKWPRTPIPVTEALAMSTLAVPMFRDMTAADVDRVVDSLVEVS